MVLFRKVFLAALLLLLARGGSLAQIPDISSPPTAPASNAQSTPADPLGRETPRGTVMGFLRAAQDENYAVAVQYFQPAPGRRRVTADQEQDLVVQLLAVINQKILASSLDSLSRDPQGRLDDGLPPNQDLLTGVREGTGSFSIQVVRTDDDHGNKIWLISRKTLASIPETYDSLEFSDLEKKLPRTLTKNRFLYMPLWQWLAILIAIPIAVAIAWLLSLIPRFVLRYYRKKNGVTTLPPVLMQIIPPDLQRPS